MENPMMWIIHTLSGKKRKYNSSSDLRRYTRAGRRENLSTPQRKKLDKRRAKNKVARKSRKINRKK